MDMKCPACGCPGAAVTKTMDNGGSISRRRLCACGAQWTTKEKTEPGTLLVSNGQSDGTLVTRSVGGDISLLPSDPSRSSLSDPDRAGAQSEKRAKSPYSDAFEATWLLYGRKEEKVKAFAAWKIAARKEGSEEALAVKIAVALEWQAPAWARDGWRFARYFERYIKHERWNDERGAQAATPTTGRPSRSETILSGVREWTPRKSVG